MALSRKDVCTPCQGKNIPSQTWCTECEVFLCMNCDALHKMSPSSKCHTIMSTETYHKLPAFMQEVSSQCQEHNQKFELYCSVHACPCCDQCVSKHKTCEDIKPLSDVLTHVKSSASVKLLEKDLEVLNENFDEILKDLKRRIDKNHQQKTAAIEEIRTMRNSIDDYLNILEQQILSDLDSKHSKLESNLNALVKQVKQQSVRIQKIQEDHLKMTQYATKLQIYVGLREIEKATYEAANYIENLENEGHLKENGIDIKISSALQSLLQDVKSFGDIKITVSCSTVQIKAGRKDQAQHQVHTVPGINQIKPSLLKTVTMPEEIGQINIYACRILINENILVLDHRQKRLLLFSKDGIFIRIVVSFNDSPYDLCIVRQHTVAISFGTLQQSALVDIEKNEIIETIKLSHICNAVTSDGQMLVISDTLDNNYTILNLKNMSSNILKGVRGSCVSLFKEFIYCADMRKHKVSCYARTGEPLWTYIHDDIYYPNGLALDNNGYVYVSSSENSNIVVVSPDGRISKKILSEADGIIRPTGIDINRETGMMIVSSKISDDRQIISKFKI